MSTVNPCLIAGCVSPGCTHGTQVHVGLPTTQPSAICFACLQPGVQQMVENAQQLERDDPNNPWVLVAKEFALACAAFVEQASSGNPNNESLVRLARAVETIKQYKAFDR